MTILEEIQKRGIVEILHFTTNKGIVGTLAKKALLSRHRLPQDEYLEHVLHVNASVRPEGAEFFDKSQNWLDYVNLSISEINRRYYDVSQRWHENSDIWWGILSFDSNVMSHDSIIFTTTNNAYTPYCSRQPGVEGLRALFSPIIQRKQDWFARRGMRAQNLPTCEQAEILYPGALSTDFLRRIYVKEGDHHDQACGWLREFGLSHVEVTIDPTKFIGCKN
ncbi:DarT ssDNA thymidine ADP-ribosyltransferase family protein [Paenacidovorax monticola]|uniref:DUF4433 domain-containing protein n=1 Tax=Paenacidovorax monticola TaxID=1926868 RepID=A0A7H0HKS9_9BURK|nr:DarT ssDNA thymidine ADP-ribosyltransferase family protein [Paenacidovorax monticola]QNP61145.1 DUF4433 domain-containing protein [Paenacidovorax monticola]